MYVNIIYIQCTVIVNNKFIYSINSQIINNKLYEKIMNSNYNNHNDNNKKNKNIRICSTSIFFIFLNIITMNKKTIPISLVKD